MARAGSSKSDAPAPVQVLWPWERPVDFDLLAGRCPVCGEQGRAVSRTQKPTRYEVPDDFCRVGVGSDGGASVLLSATMVFEARQGDFELRRAECPNGHAWGPDVSGGRDGR